MALPNSGPLSLNQIHVEAGGNSGSTASINDSDAVLAINPNGNVGIGTTSPISLSNQTSLTIKGTSVARLDLQGSGTLYANSTEMVLQSAYGKVLSIDAGTNQYISFRYANAEKIVMDSSGRLTVGTIGTDTTLSGGQPAFQVTGSAFNGYMAAVRRDTSVYSSGIILAKSRSSTADNFTALADNDQIGGIIFIGDDGTDLDTYGATITAVVNGTSNLEINFDSSNRSRLTEFNLYFVMGRGAYAVGTHTVYKIETDIKFKIGYRFIL